MLYDPNGLEWKNAMLYGRKHLIGLKYGIGITGYGVGGNWRVIDPNLATCDQIVARAYRGDEEYPGFSDFPVGIGEQVDWFKSHGYFTTKREAGEIGDVIFFGDVYTQGKRHAVIIVDVKDGKYKIMGARGEEEVSVEYDEYKSIEELEKWFKEKPFYGIGQIKQQQVSKFQKDWSGKYDPSIGGFFNKIRTYWRGLFSP